MRISIVGPALPIPPVGWGAVESLIWDMKLALNNMNHEVQIINIENPYQIINMINNLYSGMGAVNNSMGVVVNTTNGQGLNNLFQDVVVTMDDNELEQLKSTKLEIGRAHV